MKIDARRKNSHILPQAQFLEKGAFMALGRDRWALGWGDPQWSEVSDNTGFSFYLPDFFLTKSQPWLNFSSGGVYTKSHLEKFLSQLGPTEALDNIKWQEPEIQDFEKKFHDIFERFVKNEISKAVPIVFAQCQGNWGRRFRQHCLEELLDDEYLNPFGFWLDSEGLVGATPEWLFYSSPESAQLTTMALAGTSAHEVDLLGIDKERKEHQFVVDDLAENLKVYGSLKLSETYEWPLAHLKHLRTDLEIELEQTWSMEEWVSRLHPTPALGVAPRESSLDWLYQLNYAHQPELPKRHGAPFGFKCPDGGLYCLVAIRNVQWQGSNLYLGSGCGVVSESKLDSEWRELILKRRAVKKALGL